MADATGMKHAQGKDPSQGKLRRAQETSRAVTGKVGSKVGRVWGEAKSFFVDPDKKKGEAPQGEAAQQQPAGRVGSGGESELEGKDFGDFTQMFRESLRRGKSRLAKSEITDAQIRDVICHPDFVNAIDKRRVLSPYEEASPKYAEDMLAVRRDLVKQLAGREIGKLTSHEFDIIYATIFGAYTDDDGHPFWNETTWAGGAASGLPTPPEALFRFLEACAKRKHNNSPEEMGRFIGDTLKGIEINKGLVKLEGVHKPDELTIMDSRYADAYLETRYREAHDETIEEFGRQLAEVMLTPTTEMHGGLEVPGLGFRVDVHPTELQDTEDSIHQALQGVQALNGKAQQANVRLVQEDANYQHTVRTRVAIERSSDTSQLENVRATEADARGRFETAKRERTEAMEELYEAQGELERLMQKYHRLEVSGSRFQVTHKEYTDMFGDEFRDAKENLMESLPQKMPKIANPVVEDLLTFGLTGRLVPGDKVEVMPDEIMGVSGCSPRPQLAPR